MCYYITQCKENLCYFVGSHLEAISSEQKHWFIIAGAVTGWAVGFFFATRASVSSPGNLGLMVICSYAFAHLGDDIAHVINLLAKWLLEQAGESGQRYVAARMQAV